MPGTPPPQEIVTIVLAAGGGSRFGGRKQLAPLRGVPLLEHALASAAASGSDRTLLVLGADAEAIEAGIDRGGATVVRAPSWDRGHQESLRTGLAALGPEVAAALVTLGDEPLLPAAASDRLIAARRSGTTALRATYEGRPGHPVLIERRLFAPLLEGLERGANPAELLREAGVEPVPCEDLGRPADVDTPADLAALERGAPRRGVG